MIAQLTLHDKWVADWGVIRRTHACWILNVNPNTVRESFISESMCALPAFQERCLQPLGQPSDIGQRFA